MTPEQLQDFDQFTAWARDSLRPFLTSFYQSLVLDGIDGINATSLTESMMLRLIDLYGPQFDLEFEVQLPDDAGEVDDDTD